MNYAMYTARKDGFNKPEGVIGEKLGGGCAAHFQKPLPYCDQTLRFSLPYLWPDQKSDTKMAKIDTHWPKRLKTTPLGPHILR